MERGDDESQVLEIASSFNVELGQRDRTDRAIKSSFSLNSKKKKKIYWLTEELYILCSTNSIFSSAFHTCFWYKPSFIMC